MIADLPKRLHAIKQAIAERKLHMNPRLTEQDVAAFETRWRIKLPPDYRAFLLTVGDGGSGPPYCGLLRLGEVPKGYYQTAETVLANLHKPFPLTTHWIWEGEEDRPELRAAIDQGKLILGTDGCGFHWLLIVTGAEYGQVWSEADVGIQPCYPRRSFVSWYEYWLEGGQDWWVEYNPS